MANVLLRPRRMTDARALVQLRRLTPSDLDIEFEDVNFEVIDEHSGKKLKIAAWWMPQASANGRCAVLVHGYSDAKVGAIAWAPLLRSFNFNILAIDLRAHGESEGTYCTAGYYERHDLNQVIDQLRGQKPLDAAQVILFGISLGAAVVAAAAVLRDDLSAVILECPFAEYTRAVSYQAGRLGMPGPLFQDMSFKIAQWIARCDFAAVRPLDMIPKIHCPLLLIQALDDPFLSADDFAAMESAVKTRPQELGPSVVWTFPDVYHVVALAEHPEEYRSRLDNFLAAALPSTPKVCEK
jgi:hypothetical protein